MFELLHKGVLVIIAIFDVVIDFSSCLLIISCIFSIHFSHDSKSPLNSNILIGSSFLRIVFISLTQKALQFLSNWSLV